MRKKFFWEVVAILFLLNLSCLRAKVRIAILDFRTEGNVVLAPETFVEMLTTLFSQSSRFSLIERSRLESILKEVGLSVSGLVEKQSVEAGKIKDVEALVFGSLVQGKGGGMLNIRLVKTTTAEVILAESIVGSKEEIEAGIQDFLVKSERKFPLKGTVIKVEEGKLYIDLGKEDGVEKGMMFELVEQGEEVKNLKGEIIGYKKKKKGVAQVEEVDEKFSILEPSDPIDRLSLGVLALESSEKAIAIVKKPSEEKPHPDGEGLSHETVEPNLDVIPYEEKSPPDLEAEKLKLPQFLVAVGEAKVRKKDRGRQENAIRRAEMDALRGIFRQVEEILFAAKLMHIMRRNPEARQELFSHLERSIHKNVKWRAKSVKVTLRLNLKDLVQQLVKTLGPEAKQRLQEFWEEHFSEDSPQEMVLTSEGRAQVDRRGRKARQKALQRARRRALEQLQEQVHQALVQKGIWDEIEQYPQAVAKLFELIEELSEEEIVHEGNVIRVLLKIDLYRVLSELQFPVETDY